MSKVRRSWEERVVLLETCWGQLKDMANLLRHDEVLQTDGLVGAIEHAKSCCEPLIRVCKAHAYDEARNATKGRR